MDVSHGRGLRGGVAANERQQCRPIPNILRPKQRRHVFHHLDQTAADDVHAVGMIVFVVNQLAVLAANQVHAVADAGELLVGQVAENRQITQMVLEDARLVNGVHLGPINLVALDLVEDVAQHFQHVAVAVGHDGRRARRAVQTALLAKQVALVERGLPGDVGNVGRRVDGDVEQVMIGCARPAAQDGAGQPSQQSAHPRPRWTRDGQMNRGGTLGGREISPCPRASLGEADCPCSLRSARRPRSSADRRPSSRSRPAGK